MACHQAVGPSQGLPLMEMNCCGLPRFPGLYGAHASRYSLMMIRTVLYRLSIIWSSFKGGDWLLILIFNTGLLFRPSMPTSKVIYVLSSDWVLRIRTQYTIQSNGLQSLNFVRTYVQYKSADFKFCSFLKISDSSENNQEKTLFCFFPIYLSHQVISWRPTVLYCAFK